MIVIPTVLWPSDLLHPRDADLRHEFAGETMGTSWAVSCFAPLDRTVDGVRSHIEAELNRLVLQMSHWRDDSELANFNRAPPGEWTTLSPEFFNVLRFSLDVASRSDGAFDPALGRQVDHWGFGPAGPRQTPPGPLVSALAPASWRDIELDGSGRRARHPGGIYLNLSAVAKGYAVDHLARLLNTAGIHSYLVEIGGELRGRGVKRCGQPWWVQVEPPREGAPHLKVALSGYAVATSGDYRRYFEHGGARYAHTLHPVSGAPLPDPPASVSVIHRECMAADAWSTALTVLGPESGLALCARERIAAVYQYFVDGDWKVRASLALQEMLE